ncbi:hypothetical protein GCM10011579_060290 [Streptomyces albiflavescens]|uniref:Uncharacterized protein n=1 Tax=Streptomyces albiflavescens TaxID=1623582 RepID=A0A918D7Z0_9ACTN|nr:hypothetical protein GCM10011579_060290 [Streptomyces albiflavescens]
MTKAPGQVQEPCVGHAAANDEATTAGGRANRRGSCQAREGKSKTREGKSNKRTSARAKIAP